MDAPQASVPVVLVVDDEPGVLRLMERVLMSEGYQVHSASGGLQALELVAGLPSPPDVLVTDLRMDPIDGADLARLIRERPPVPRVLFVSGYPSDPSLRQLPGPLLKKPFGPDQLAQAVAQLLGVRERPDA